MSTKILYITGTDVSVDRNISVADAYDYIDPITGTATSYINTAEGLTLGPSGGITLTQEFSGDAFNQTQLVYKRTNEFTFSGTYSQYDTFVFNLSGIEDSSNNIIRIDWQPLSGSPVQSVEYGLDTEFSSQYVYNLAAGLAIGENPKDDTYEYVYNLDSLTDTSLSYESLTTFQPAFSAFRQDGLVDIYNCSLTVSKDSIFNVANKLKLLDSQVLPISSLDPLLKIELEGPNYVNNLVIRRAVTPTPTRTISNTPANPTPTQTQTQTPTRSYTPTQTGTKYVTPTPTRTQSQTVTLSPSKTINVSPTTTPTITRTNSQTQVIKNRVTPTPSKSSNICLSQECTVSYTGINDKAAASSITLNLIYNHDGAGNTKTLLSKNITNIFGTYEVKFNIPLRWVSNYLSAEANYQGENPGISINSINITNTCDKANKPDTGMITTNKLPSPIPPPTPTPKPTPTYNPPASSPESDNTNYYTFVFYPGATNNDCGTGFDLPCERNFNINWRILRTSDNIAFSEGEFDLSLVGCYNTLQPLGAPLYVKIPYNDQIADSRGWIAGDEVIGGNYTFVYTYKSTAISNDPSALDVDGNAAGPCLFGDIDYTTEVVFAGPGQDPQQYTLIPEEKWIDQDKNFTLVFNQS
jgi:hypothetical protein